MQAPLMRQIFPEIKSSAAGQARVAERDNSMAGKFVMKRAKNGEFFFSLIAGNGENVGKSETYKARASADNGIESVKRNAPEMDRYVIKEGNDGKHYLSLKASNGQIILTGQGYSSESGAEKGREAIARAADGAAVVDETDA